MAEGYDSLVLQAEWFFMCRFIHSEVHLFWISMESLRGSHLHVPLVCGKNIRNMQLTSLLVTDTENINNTEFIMPLFNYFFLCCNKMCRA